ncbi:MAG: TonB-dependent receptor [Dysgonamonadaceae bacterium]|jgi:TonB-linked SusC/RagA family outer membrane protein|nr:TonB-dependent receptor [Dysgonamonadaceae bacterium]
MKHIKKLQFSLFFLLIFIAQTGFAQLNISAENQPVKQIILQIEKSSEYRFFYSDDYLDLEKQITVEIKNETIESVLGKIFKGTNIQYTIGKDKQILLASDKQKYPDQKAVATQKYNGNVADANGEPVIGASVAVKGSKTGTVTDVDGKFSIEAPVGSTLSVSYIGYLTQEIQVRDKTSIRITLKENEKLLDEVVVLGYGAQARKADLSAAVGTLSNVETLKRRPVQDVAQMLQGQIPGVTVRQETGSPTKGPNITIRGRGSKQGEDVLWVVDGIPGGNYNFDEVESVVVLKDAASAAIYGAQSGSAGVILVTTKKAKKGEVTINYDGTFGVNHPYNLPQSLTAEEQIRVKTIAAKNAGKTLDPGWDPAVNPWIATTRTDWVDLIFRDAFYQRHTLSLSGGTETYSNLLSANYVKNEGTILNTYSDMVQLRYNAMFKPVKWVKLTEEAWFNTSSNRNYVDGDGYNGTLQQVLGYPRSAVPYYPDGSIGGTTTTDPDYIAKYGGNFAGIHGELNNPLRGLVDGTDISLPANLKSTTFLEIGELVPGLRFTSRFTYSFSYGFAKHFKPKRPEPGTKDGGSNNLSYDSSRSYAWENENTFNYDQTFGDHNVGALVSATLKENSFMDFSASASGFEREKEEFLYFVYGNSFTHPGSNYGIDRNLSYVGRASYSFANRYFLTASMRRDYAGRLPKGKKYADFPSVTAGWKLSEEAFMPKIDAINLIKLRGSWGRIGNLGSIDSKYAWPALDGYFYYNQYKNSGGGVIGKDNPKPTSPVQPGKVFNPLLTWETSEQLDFGIDLGLLNNRLDVSFDWFNKRTFNLLTTQSTGWPSYIGLEPPKINEGEIRNTGIEASATWKDKIGEVSYFVSGNIATLDNKIYNIGAATPKIVDGKTVYEKTPWRWNGWGDDYRGVLVPFQSREGDPLYSYWLYRTDGIFQTEDEVKAHVDKDGNMLQPNAKPGDLKFIDKNGDGKFTDDDREYMGSYFPKVTYALNLGLTWKNLSFSMMLQGVEGVKIFNAFKYVMLNEGGSVTHNRWNKILDAWPVTNNIPRINASDPNDNFTRNSDWYLEDGSYLRIKNITVAYDLTSLLHRSQFLDNRKSRLSLSAGVDNLFTFTKYSGIDPEVGGNGMDTGIYPVATTYSFGIKLTF